jgi:hypothetical protein
VRTLSSELLRAFAYHFLEIMRRGEGNFSVPMFVHSQTPPGVTEMTDRRADITYTFEEMPMRQSSDCDNEP